MRSTILLEGVEVRIITTYMRESRKENWRCIVEKTERWRGKPIITGGDFNARTAEEGGRVLDRCSHRRSKDKTMNKEGEDMLEIIRENGLSIINGGEKDKGNGEFTYIGGAGISVIDYVN